MTVSRAGARGGGAPVLERVDGEGDGGAGRRADLREQQPDRPAADDRHAGGDVDVAEVDRVDGDAERLEQRARDAVERVRQRVQPVGRPAQVLAERSVPAPVPREPDLRAEVRMALAAQVAALARDRRVDGHAPAGQRPLLHDARELVPDHERRGQPRVADRALLEPVQVGAADADGLHADEALPRFRSRRRLVAQPHVAHAVEARDPHGSRVRVSEAPSSVTCSSPSWMSPRRAAASPAALPTM